MKRIFKLAVAAVVFGTACVEDATTPDTTTGRTAPLVARAGDDVIPGQYIVVLKAGVQDVDATARMLAMSYGGTVGFTYTHAIKGFSVHLSDTAAAKLAQHPLVAYVEQDAVVRALERGPSIDDSPTTQDRLARTAEVRQPNVTWGLDRVDQRDLLFDGSYFHSATGAGVKVYIIESGIRLTHDEFERPDGSSRAITGVDIITPGGTASDCRGGGTHDAGVVGGKTWGVAKEATLVSVRVLDCDGTGTVSQLIEGVDWVTADHQGALPAVVSMNLLAPFNQSINDAVTRSIGDGVTYAVLAGFQNADACNFSPPSTPLALTVAFSDIIDARGSTSVGSSNWGTCVDIFAPGVNIRSAWWTSDQAAATTVLGGIAAYVAGAAALYLETNPGAAPTVVEPALENRATLNKITNPGTGSPNLLLYTRWIGGGLTNPQGVIASTLPLTGSPFGLDVASTDVTYITRFASDLVERVNLPTFAFAGSVSVGDVPTGIAFNPAGTTAWVTNQHDGTVGVIDVATNTQIRTIALEPNTAVVAVRPDGAIVYVTSTNGNVYAIDAATDAIVATVPAGFSNGLAFNPSGTRLYASQVSGGTVKEIDAQSHAVLRTFSTGGTTLQGLAVSLDGTELYVADEGASVLRVVNVGSGAQVATVALGGGGFGVALSPDNARLYVSLPGGGAVKVIGRASRTVVATLSTGGRPRRLDFSALGETAVIADESGNVHFVK